jgi:hypothetical protein
MTTNLQTPMLQHPDVVAPTATPFPAQVANFNLIQATKRSSDKAPHYFGYFKLDGQWYSVSTWIQFTKNTGQQLLNNSIRPCTPEEAAKQEAYAAQFQQQQGQRPVQTVADAGNPLHAGAPVENPVETRGIPPVDYTNKHPF